MQVSAYHGGMNRKASVLLPIELAILEAAQSLRAEGCSQFHGFGLAQRMQSQQGARALTAHGTLYRALGRLEKRNYLESSWEDFHDKLEGRHLRRRLYKLTRSGDQALAAAQAAAQDAQTT